MSNIDKQALRGQNVEGSFYLAECGYCGQVMPSSKLRALHSPDGEADCYCPHCNAEDCEIFDLGAVDSEVVNAWNYQQKRIEALLDELEAAEKRIAELEARRVPDSFNIIGENIRTQDNRITSEPLFCVFQKREIVVDEDYDCDRIVWVDEEGCEATERQRMRLELLHDNCRETPDKWRRIAVKDIDDFVTCCFTEQGCRDYLACNGHNLRLPFIYVKSGFRNAEYIGIRNWLAGIGKGE